MGGFIGKNTKRGTTTVSKKHVVIVGASGELGTAVSSAFIKEGHNVYGISSRPSHTSVHIPLNQALSYAESSKGAFDELSKHIEKVDAVICLAGGWAGGSAGDEGVFESLEKMYQANMRSALLAAHIATRLLKKDGLLVMTGSAAAMSPTPSMVAYGMTKCATMHLMDSIAHDSSMSQPFRSVMILPVSQRCLK
eukprot:TRINITY_DN3748_c0_g1_i1.p1 TRINITY_DN3748_c0_g1~~TRINITY_DN3748_c0_g1_i1.p1  ORF type:complete len:194 (+),score=26.43 TRINITY_DN3748_c0_g1_i1:64-645(+)